MPRPSARLATAVALAFLATSCSSISVKPAVSVRAIPVDLVFGGRKPEKPKPLGLPQLPPDFDLIIDFAPPPPDLVPPPPPPLRCDTITNATVRHPAPSTPRLTDRPTTGQYLFQAKAVSPSGTRVETRAAHHRIDCCLDERTQGPDPDTPDEGPRDGFSYTLLDDFTGTIARFRMFGEVEDPSDTKAEFGFFLERIGWPETLGGQPDMDDDVSKALTNGEFDGLVQPAPSLKVLHFPLLPENEELATGYDPFSRAYFESESTVIGLDRRVPACNEYAAAWQVVWELRVFLPDQDADADVNMHGSFWFATQWGGFPIKADYFLEGDLLTGHFTHTILTLEPIRR